ncbi:ASKHA domain-containing protein [Salinispira pacifica]
MGEEVNRERSSGATPVGAAAGPETVPTTIEIAQGSAVVHLAAPKDGGTTLLALLAEEPEIQVPAPCGGHGRCGKCAVLVNPDGPSRPEPSPADLRFLKPFRLAEGYRLACTCPVSGIDRVVAPPRDRSAFVKSEVPHFDAPADVWQEARSEGRFAVAVDIGTTTVASYLFDTESGEVESVVAEMNRQGVFGADVLSRISFSERAPGNLEHLSRAIRAQLTEMIAALAGGRRPSPGMVVVTGNTTMLHLLAGVSPSGIGRAPFTPAFTECRRLPSDELRLGNRGSVILLPSQAGYVGADIMSAAVAVDMDRDPRTTLLVDIGTNGEIALSHGGTVYTCATAAGPAFEGATISSGVGGVAGALSRWSRSGDVFSFDTIAGLPVVGICGSGLLDLVASLLSDEIVDETGRIDPPRDTPAAWQPLLVEVDGAPAVRYAGGYYLTQKDLREVQLAKAAIAAGIEILCAEAGIETASIERLVLTGGFGNHLRSESAVRIGLLPSLPPDRIVTVDNAAGRGAVLTLRASGTLDRIKKLALQARYIELSGHALFQERYVEQMFFPEVDS